MPYQREVRLGIVLYGGVSLAVYENGVAQELHRAVCGKSVYGLLKELIDSEVVVDVISGTSAGGVNGVMLAYALANRRSFAASADLWRQQGDIQALLRSKRDPNAASILDSEYYQDKLRDCFQNTLSVEDKKAPRVSELDLFVTGTDANGETYTVYDDQGHAIDVKNHRALFKLAVRGDRKNNLRDATPSDLATLARLTSCFPAAFEPVRIAPTDKNLLLWGKLRNPAVYLDGGILNNKPFTSTIDAIATRTANREVERFLIYVEPDPEVFGGQISCAPPNSPPVVQAALSALTSIPGYQSIAGDLEEIEAHNERAERVASIIDAIGDAPETDPDCLDKAGVLPEEPSDPGLTAYIACRSIQLRDTAAEGILNDANGRGYISSTADRRSGRILVTSFGYWPGNVLDTLDNYDVFFRMRRAAYLSRSLMRGIKARGVKTRKLHVEQSAWDLVNHYFKLYEMTQWAMVNWLNMWNPGWKELGPRYPQLDTQTVEEQREILKDISIEVWGRVKDRLDAMLHAGIEVPSSQTAEARETYYQSLAGIMKAGSSPAGSSPGNLLQDIDRSFAEALKGMGESEAAKLLRNEFCRFVSVDRQLFPIQTGSGFESTDVIRVVRFSPLDAQRGLSRGPTSSKVCGSALGAFGGFFKKSWRANDIMVGRFDACCQLLECLLTKERLADLPAGRTFQPAQLSHWFGKLDNAEIVTLTSTINTYLRKPREATEETWNDLLDEIVAAAHKEIEDEEWPRVVACALQQEYAWGRYKRNSGSPREAFDDKNLVWNRAQKNPDEVLMNVAAHAIATGEIAPYKPGSIAGRPFLDELPLTILQELGFLAGIRLEKSVLASIKNDGIRERVQKNHLRHITTGMVIPVLYQLARIRRTQPESVIVINTAIPVACLSVIALALVLMIFKLDVRWLVGFEVLGIAVLTLGIWTWLFRK